MNEHERFKDPNGGKCDIFVHFKVIDKVKKVLLRVRNDKRLVMIFRGRFGWFEG